MIMRTAKCRTARLGGSGNCGSAVRAVRVLVLGGARRQSAARRWALGRQAARKEAAASPLLRCNNLRRDGRPHRPSQCSYSRTGLDSAGASNHRWRSSVAGAACPGPIFAITMRRGVAVGRVRSKRSLKTSQENMLRQREDASRYHETPSTSHSHAPPRAVTRPARRSCPQREPSRADGRFGFARGFRPLTSVLPCEE
jgi:hypothetical protein